jgi:hypothetical protein
MLDKLRAVFLLAGLDVKSFHKLPNGYCGDTCCLHRPWALAETKYGLIKIGWRKRVISIEWPTEAGVHGNDTLPKDEQKSDKSCGTTSWENGVHAWGWGNAVNQLGQFADLADRVIFNREANARLTVDELKEFQELTSLNNPPARRSALEEQRYQTLYKKWRGSN